MMPEAASSVADFGAVILLSLFFSGEGSGVGSTLLLIVASSCWSPLSGSRLRRSNALNG